MAGGNELARLDDLGTMAAGYELLSFDDLHLLLLEVGVDHKPYRTTIRVAGTTVNP
jgi:hypothetical protein